MIQAWIESVVIKRLVLAAAAALASYAAGHLVPDLGPALAWLGHYGVNVQISVDPERLKDSLTLLFFAASQGAHEWAAAKYPELAKWI